MWQWLLLLGVCGLMGCAAPMHGPDVDLRALARPEPEPVPAALLPPPPPSLPSLTTEQGWKTWVPSQTARDGSVSDGHWVDTSRKGLTPQLVEPLLTIPRPPKGPQHVRPKNTKQSGPPVMQPSPQLHSGPDGAPPGMLPPADILQQLLTTPGMLGGKP